MDQPPNPHLNKAEQSPPSSQSLPPSLHRDDADEEDDNVKQLQQCSSVYLALQDCLINSNRDWKACQREVQALKACNERRKNANKSKNSEDK